MMGDFMTDMQTLATAANNYFSTILPGGLYDGNGNIRDAIQFLQTTQNFATKWGGRMMLPVHKDNYHNTWLFVREYGIQGHPNIQTLSAETGVHRTLNTETGAYVNQCRKMLITLPENGEIA